MFLKRFLRLSINPSIYRFSEFVSHEKGLFKSSKDSDALGNIIEHKNQIIHFTNFAKNELKLNKILKTENNNYAILLTLNDKISTALLLDTSSNKEQSSIKIAENQEYLSLSFSQNIFGNVINYQGNPINKEQKQQNQEQREIKQLQIFTQSKIKHKKVLSNTQLFSGNLAVDFSYPIAKGHFTIIKGEMGTGKTYLTSQFMKNFCKNTSNIFQKNNPRKTYAIYCSLDTNSALKIQSQLQADNLNNFVCLSIDAGDPLIATKYFLPFSALKLANTLQEQNHDVLLVFDNVYEHFLTELMIFNNIKLPFSTQSILKEMFSWTGNYKSLGSLTTFCCFDNNKVTNSYKFDSQKLLNEAESYADNIIELNLNEVQFRNVLPKISLNSSKYFKQPWQEDIIFQLSKQLNGINELLCQQKKEIQLKEELKIHVDPWDVYLYHDSKYFMKMLLSNRYFSVVEQIVFMQFVLRSIEEESVSQFKDDPKKLTEEFFNFAKSFKEFEEKNIFEYVESWLLRTKEQQDDVYIKNIFECINRLYELFMMHLKMNDKLLPYKRDYFN